MGDPQYPVLEKPCEICGNVGWIDPLTICSICNDTREHLYCMRVAYGGHREKWICEECDPSYRIPSSKDSKPAPKKQPSVPVMKISMKKPPHNSKVQYLSPEEAICLESGAMRSNLSSPSKSRLGHRPSGNKPVSSTPPQKSRIKLNPPVGPSGLREPPNNWRMAGDLRYRKTSLYTDGPARQPCGESTTAKRVTFGELLKPSVEGDNINLGHTSVQISQHSPTKSSDGCAQEVCINTRTFKHLPDGKLSKDDINSGHASELAHPFPTVTSGIDVGTEAQPKKIDSKENGSPRATLVLDCSLRNHPAESLTWKGTFQITNDAKICSSFNGIQAYPSCKVHRNVYEVSKQFPKTLPFQMLPRKDFWDDIFENDAPSELDIGLYFLSSRTSNLNGGFRLPSSTCDIEQSYCFLVEYLDKHDLLLRSCFDEVELLVFSSKLLPLDSRKMNQKHFLWALLRPFKANVVSSNVNLLARNSEMKDEMPKQSRIESLAMVDGLHSSNNQQVLELMPEADDMDLDMLAGQELCNTDVVPKPNVEALSNSGSCAVLENLLSQNSRMEEILEQSSRVESLAMVDGLHSSDIQQVQEPMSEAEDMELDMLAGQELCNIDIVVQKPNVEALPNSGSGTVLEISPIKIKREGTDGSCVDDDELEFEKELQRSFDRFTALLQVKLEQAGA